MEKNDNATEVSNTGTKKSVPQQQQQQEKQEQQPD